ncbi:MAG TPA: hypothetical protein VD838_17895, partial [Anaeromyxobacteraceae bacterium]|nr:hypothetical protein [Anaeromyxobacteraceae bacterium]
MPSSTRARVRRLVRDHGSRIAAGGLAAVHVALALALAFVEAPLFAKYTGLAARLREGTLSAAQVSDASPGYLLLHLFLSPAAVRGLQLAASAATVYLVARIGARLAGPTLGLAAAAALGLAGPWLLYPSVLEPDLLIGALNLGAVATLLLAGGRRLRLSTGSGRTEGDAERSGGTEGFAIGPRVAAVAGALLGLSAALRPTTLLLSLVAFAWVIWPVRPEPVDGRPAASPARRRLVPAIAFGAALVVAATAPVLGLRALAGAALERGSRMSVGAVVHLGHRPEGVGLGATYPTLLKLVELQSFGRADRTPDFAHELYRTFASAAEGRSLTAPEAERYWLGRTLGFAREAPGAFAANLGRKLAFSVAGPVNDHDIPEVQRAALEAPVPALSLRWLALAGAGGLLVLLGARVRGSPRTGEGPPRGTLLLAG